MMMVRMTYDKKLLSKWLDARAEIFIGRCARGLIGKAIPENEVRNEFKIIALELHEILDEMYRQAVEEAENKNWEIEWGRTR